jgi:hypothetical protein
MISDVGVNILVFFSMLIFSKKKDQGTGGVDAWLSPRC